MRRTTIVCQHFAIGLSTVLGALVAESEPVMESARHDYLEVMQIILRKQDIYPEERMLGID